MQREPKYRGSTRRHLASAQWRRLGIVIGALLLLLIVVVILALLVALGEISFG